MSFSQHKFCAALLAPAAGMAGCAGNGEGLNTNGLPISSSRSSGGSGSGTGGDPGGSSSGGSTGPVTVDSGPGWFGNGGGNNRCQHAGATSAELRGARGGQPHGDHHYAVAPLLPGTYRVTVRGTGGGVLADLNAQVLGSDYSFTFTVDTFP